ncbi:MAG: glycosyltransferase family 2 protein [Cyanobacteria bacterium J06554_6]
MNMTDPPAPLADTLVIIPALNEAETIGAVIRALQFEGLTRIRVIDNGSSDDTAIVAKAAGAEVIQELVRGYGQACWRGLQELPADVGWILFCDADGSDDLGQLPKFFAQREAFDLILGNRRGTATGRANLSPVQWFGNGLSGALMGLGWGHRFKDLGPLRLIRREALERMRMCDRNFGWTVEMQVKAIEQGLRMAEIPVNYRPRQGGQSKISGTLSGSVKAGTIILSTLAKLYWRRLWPQLSISENASDSIQRILTFLSVALLVLGSIGMAPHGNFLTDPTAVPNFWRATAVMGVGFGLSWMVRSVRAGWFWVGAIAPRLILLAMAPGDDIWRYLWEGYLQTQGLSPYEFAPNAAALVPLRTDWWHQINHLDVSAIYPPVTQFGFRALATVGLSVLLFKAAFVATDLAICWLLSRRYGYGSALVYAWNPLVIYSFAGGGHYDSWFMLPLVAAWLWFDRPADENNPGTKRPPLTYLGSALLVGVSIAIKWISLPVLAFLTWHGLRRGRVGLSLLTLAAGLLPILVSALPFCSATACPLIPTGSVFVNYGRSAELVPYWVAQLWEPSRWENWLFALPLALLVTWLLLRTTTVQKFTEWYLIGLLLLSPIVHGWYFAWLVPLGVVSQNWGTRLVSLSAFIYFALPHRIALGDASWFLSLSERYWLWGPFLLGLLYSSGCATWRALPIAQKLKKA